MYVIRDDARRLDLPLISCAYFLPHHKDTMTNLSLTAVSLVMEERSEATPVNEGR